MLTTTFRLGSSDFVNAPGLIAWAINGAAFEKDRKVLCDIVSKTWGVPHDATIALLTKQVPYTIDGGTVVFAYGAPVTVPAALMRDVMVALDYAHSFTKDGERVFLDPLEKLRALLPTPPKPARHRGVFSDFDYDYIAMIEQLPGWNDSTWRNDTSPSATPEDDRFRLWFDYENPALSEHEEQRREGTMKRFTLTIDWPTDNDGVEPGTTVFASDYWLNMKSYILDGEFEAYRAALPKS